MGYNDVSGRPRALKQSWIAAVLAAAVLLTAATDPGVALADDPVAKASSGVTLRKGDRGRAVRALQRKLRIVADGVFGPQTARAVRRFQRRRGLVADAIVGPITRRALGLRKFGRDSVNRGGRSGGGGAPAGEGRPSIPAVLRRIAECESGGNPRAISPDGRYRGKYQFSRGTWKDYGGRGSDPAKASEAHQDRIALRLYRARGTAPWPSCGGR